MKLKTLTNILCANVCFQISAFAQTSHSNTAIKATLSDILPAPASITKKTLGADIIFLLHGEYKTEYTFKLNIEAINDYDLISPVHQPINGKTEIPGVEHMTPYRATKVENPPKNGKVIVKVVGKWLPHSKVFTPSAKIGTLIAGGDLTVSIEYKLNWEARLCGTETQYRNLKWTLNTPNNSVLAPLKTGDIINFQPQFGVPPGVGAKINNGAIFTATVPNNNFEIISIDLGNTVSWSTDHMRIDAFKLDFANHVAPPAGIVSGANPQFVTITKEGTELEFVDSGHALVAGIRAKTTGVVTPLPAFIFFGPVSSLNNPAIIIP